MTYILKFPEFSTYIALIIRRTWEDNDTIQNYLKKMFISKVFIDNRSTILTTTIIFEITDIRLVYLR